MKEIFTTIQEDLESLDSALGYQIPFFRFEGNCFLIGDNEFKSNFLLQEYAKHCKLNLNFEDLQKLKPLTKSYRTLLASIALSMEKNISADKQLKDALDTTDMGAGGNFLIFKFAKIRQQIQKLLTEMNSYLINSYSLKSIPPLTIQSAISKNLDDFNYNQDEVDMLVDVRKLKTEGMPDLEKFKAHEAKTSTIRIDLSAQTELIDKVEYFEMLMPDLLKFGILEDALIAAMSEVYTEIYTFLYEQLDKHKLERVPALQSLQAKYPDIKKLLAEYFAKVFALLEEDLGKNGGKEFKQIAQKFLRIYNDKAQIQRLFKYDNPRVYDIEIRQANAFESQNYKAFLAADIFLHPTMFNGTQTLVSTFALVPSPQSYEIIAILICNSRYNKAWSERALQMQGLGILAEAENSLDIALEKDRSQYEADKNLLMYMSS